MTGLEILRRERLIAIVRGIPVDATDMTAEALASGGVRLIEVTLNTPGALETVSRWRTHFAGRLTVGAGTVLSLEMAKRAVDAGAEFLVAPNVDEAVIGFAQGRGLEVYPGALTPSEIARAFEAGASAVKVFPVNAVGGPKYIRDVLAPLDRVPLIAVGGVTADNGRAFLEAGALALGAGSALVDPALVAAGRFEELEARARAFVAAISNLEPGGAP